MCHLSIQEHLKACKELAPGELAPGPEDESGKEAMSKSWRKLATVMAKVDVGAMKASNRPAGAGHVLPVGPYWSEIDLVHAVYRCLTNYKKRQVLPFW